jgi:hypothetical protein
MYGVRDLNDITSYALLAKNIGFTICKSNLFVRKIEQPFRYAAYQLSHDKG